MASSVNLSYVRGYNDASVVARLRRVEAADRAELAEATGLTPQAVSKILARLMADGLVEEAGRRQGGRGKPAHLYRLRPGIAHAIGVHVTRSELHAVALDLRGTLLGTRSAPLPPRFTPAELVREIVAVVSDLRASLPGAGDGVIGVGIGIPGPVDRTTGVAQGIRWWADPAAVPLRTVLTERLGCPVTVDGNTASALHLIAWERGDDMTDGLFALVDFGVGAALWLDGTVHRGAHDSAGEIGHTVIDLSGPECDCGRLGCVEILHRQADQAGDVARASRALAVGIANVMQTLDVPLVLLGGSSVDANPQAYVAAVHAELATTQMGDRATVETIHHASADLVAKGAALGVLDGVHSAPRPTPGSAAVGGGGPDPHH